MLATAQGPPAAPATFAGKIFASVMAFISVGSIVAALGFLFGPFFGVILRMETERAEKEIQVHVLRQSPMKNREKSVKLETKFLFEEAVSSLEEAEGLTRMARSEGDKHETHEYSDARYESLTAERDLDKYSEAPW